MAHPSIDITIPVFNEERCVEQSLTALARHLEAECPYDWFITVVDNGSKDWTWSLANSFAAANARIRVLRLDRPGRGGALKAAWSTSNADIVAYMDVDLSTDLDSLRSLLDPIVAGEADISIGSRLATGATIQRSAQRELVSRIYNVIARRAFGYPVLDAQCGFKAVRASVARTLIPRIQDDSWFFDTELLVLAWRDGLHINEVPVRWIEDDDSRVKIIKTAADDLRGIWRLWRGGGGQKPTTSLRCRAESSGAVISERAREEEQAVDFDPFATRYEEAVDRSISFTGRDSAFYAGRKVEVLEALTQGVGRLNALSVLDVGCGSGTTDRFLVDRVGTLCGVDVSEEMLALARENAPSSKFTWYDGEKLPFQDGTFDVIIAICVLHHVPRSKRFKFVSEMNRVARPGGLIAVFEHNPFNPLTRHAVNSCELDKDAILISSRQTAALMMEAGAIDPRCCNYLFTPFGGLVGRGFDRVFRNLPLGGQYAVSARACRQ